jgi:hypothetical protein
MQENTNTNIKAKANFTYNKITTGLASRYLFGKSLTDFIKQFDMPIGLSK